MKKSALISYIILFLLFSISKISAQGVAVNTTGAAASQSAMLDVSSTVKGQLIPRMTQLQRNSILLPANALLVYQTDGVPGFYYNAGTPGSPNWMPLLSANPSPAVGTGGWTLTGNAGTSSASNFLGTSDAADLVFKTNGNERLRIYNGNGLLTAPLTAAASVALETGALSGATSNTGIKIGAISGAGTGTGINITSISSSGATNTGISIGAISGAATNNFGLKISGTTAAASNFSIYADAPAKNYFLGKIGAGTASTSPNTQLDIDGDMAIRESAVTPSGSLNDYDIGTRSYICFTGNPGTDFLITGFAGGVDGKILIITNNTNRRMTLKNENTSSLEQNRLKLYNNADVIEEKGGGCIFIYSVAAGRWFVVGNAKP